MAKTTLQHIFFLNVSACLWKDEEALFMPVSKHAILAGSEKKAVGIQTRHCDWNFKTRWGRLFRSQRYVLFYMGGGVNEGHRDRLIDDRYIDNGR